MSEKQNKVEYEKCKAKGLLGRIDIKLLKKFGTKEELAARGVKAEPEAPAKPEKTKKK